MATSAVKTKVEEVISVKTTNTVTLELTPREAYALWLVCGRVTGNEIGLRGETSKVWASLKSCFRNTRFNPHEKYFNDKPELNTGMYGNTIWINDTQPTNGDLELIL